MAEIAGKSGSITYTGLTAGVKSWTLNYEAEMLEATDFADGASSVRSYIPGLKGWTATVEANVDDSVVPLDVAGSATLTLTVTSGTAYTGVAFVTVANPTVAVDGISTVTYEFQGTAGLTIPS